MDEDEHFWVLASDDVMFSRLGGIKSNFRRYFKDFGMSRVALESFNAQDVAEWCESEAFAEGTEVITPSRRAQNHAFTTLATAAIEGRLHIELPQRRGHRPHGRVDQQHGTCRVDKRAGQNLKYGVGLCSVQFAELGRR